jgi:hypothetical protein
VEVLALPQDKMTGLAGLAQYSLISHLLAVVLAQVVLLKTEQQVVQAAAAGMTAMVALGTHRRPHHHREITAETG